MKIEQTQNNNEWKVWLNRDECEKVAKNAREWEHEIAIRLMSEVGLRSHEVRNVAYNDVKRSSDGEGYFLRVYGKNTTGEHEHGKYREAWLPDSLEKQLHRFTSERDIDPETPLFGDNTVKTIRNWVKYAAQDTAESTGNTDYSKVSAHDLRRSWAQYHLVTRGVSPEIMMSVGGWSSYHAIRPYLTTPTEQNIAVEMTGDTV